MPLSRQLLGGTALAAVTAVASPCDLAAQEADTNAAGQDEDAIIVTATRIRGSVDTNIPPVDELEEGEVQALGASSLAEVIEAIAPETTSGRGRGGGRPIFLINSQRISSFRELRDLPPEAIRRVQVFPEELALQYGFRPNQRVINFILKSGFASFNGEIEYGIPQDSGFSRTETEATFTRIGNNYRLNIDAEYERGTPLTENERDIVSGATSSDIDETEFRTLIAESDRFELNTSWSRLIGPQSNVSLNANFELEDQTSLLGLPTASLVLPASNPFSPFAVDTEINPVFTSPGPLTRDTSRKDANFGGSLNSLLGDWRWSLTADFNYSDLEQITQRGVNVDDLQAGLTNGDLDPFAEDFGDDLRFSTPDISDSTNQALQLRNSFSGKLFELPAGPVRVTLGQNYSQRWLDSIAVIAGVTSLTDLDRRNINATANIELPLIDRDTGALGFLGEFALNANYGISDLSDFGRLEEFGVGFRWSPAQSLTFQASYIGDENAPDIEAVGAPITITPNQPIFDFATNQTVFADIVTGGNPLLLPERLRDIKLSVSWSPPGIDGLRLQSEYFRNRSRNVTASFPLLTPEIEAAFPGRVVRDISGTIVSLDQRNVNYDRFRSQSLRTGLTLRGRIGSRGRGRPPTSSQRPGGRPEAERPTGQAGRAAARPSRRAAGFRPRGRPSRWRLSLFHTWRFQDEILIRPGVAELERLNGSSRDFFGGTPRHEIELSGGFFHKGLGMRMRGNYRNGTRVNGSGLVDSTDLRFSGRFLLNAVFFVNMDNRGQLTKKLPFLKGSRIRLRVRNIFNDFIKVTDSNGERPLRYQRGFVDPEGRYFELSFRKRF